VQRITERGGHAEKVSVKYRGPASKNTSQLWIKQLKKPPLQAHFTAVKSYLRQPF